MSVGDKLREINKRWKRGEFINGLDPNFGYETKGTTEINSANTIRGTAFSCPESGTANSITFYVRAPTLPTKIKCAIYKVSDNSLVGYTEEWTSTSLYNDWKTLNIVWGGALTAATDYYLSYWQNAELYLYYTTDVAFTAFYDTETYNGFPDPLIPVTPSANRKFSIYCTYTAAGPPTGWRKLQYFSEPPTAGQFNKLRFASEPPVASAWNRLLYDGE